MKRKIILSALALLLVSPTLVFAAGLVPCGGPGEPGCQFCYGLTLMNNLMDWLIVVMTALFALIFIVAGYRLVVSTGNAGEMAAAKKMITNAFIGFVLILAGWLLVDFILKALLSPVGATGPLQPGSTILGPWNSVACYVQPTSTIVPASNGLVNGGVAQQTCADPTACAALATACTGGGGVPTSDTSTVPTTVTCMYPATSSAGGSCAVITDPTNPCDPSNLGVFGSNANNASKICNLESHGAPVMSGSDLCCGPSTGCSGAAGAACNACNGAPSFSGGYFQINILAHSDKIPGCDLSSFYQANGSSAQGNCVRRNASGVCTGWSCSITPSAAYNACKQGAINPTTNMQIAGQLYNASGFTPWQNSKNACGVP